MTGYISGMLCKNPVAPGLRGQLRNGRALVDVLAFTVLMAGLLGVVVHGAAQSGYVWQWYRAWRFLIVLSGDAGGEGGPVAGLLLQGLGVTLQVAGGSLVLALILAGVAVALRLSCLRTGRLVARLYVESVRNTPLLVQLFVTYFAIAPVFGLGRMASAVMALGVFEGAYMAEILRAGITAVPQGQWEASRSLGMDEPGTYVQVILPQALRRSLPPLTGQAVSLVKDSSLASAIAIHELTMQAQTIIAETFLTFEVWLLTAGVYLFVTLSLSAVARQLERRMHFDV